MFSREQLYICVFFRGSNHVNGLLSCFVLFSFANRVRSWLDVLRVLCEKRCPGEK